MFGMFKVEKKDITPAEQKLDEIRNILFPPSKLDQSVDETGQLHKWQVDYSADMNLDAALIDLQEGHNDKVVQNTVKSVIDTLIEVRRILDAHMELDKDAEYIVVENKKDELDIEASD